MGSALWRMLSIVLTVATLCLAITITVCEQWAKMHFPSSGDDSMSDMYVGLFRSRTEFQKSSGDSMEVALLFETKDFFKQYGDAFKDANCEDYDKWYDAKTAIVWTAVLTIFGVVFTLGSLVALFFGALKKSIQDATGLGVQRVRVKEEASHIIWAVFLLFLSAALYIIACLVFGKSLSSLDSFSCMGQDINVTLMWGWGMLIVGAVACITSSFFIVYARVLKNRSLASEEHEETTPIVHTESNNP